MCCEYCVGWGVWGGGGGGGGGEFLGGCMIQSSHRFGLATSSVSVARVPVLLRKRGQTLIFRFD